MGGRVPSGADRQVLDAARHHDVRVSARQLERWRQLGAIPTPRRRSLGRGRGRTSSYEDFEVDYIVEYARRARRRRHHIAVVLSIYCDGVLVPEHCLRGAYAEMFELLAESFRRRAVEGDAIELAENLAIAHVSETPTSDPLRASIRRAWRTLKRDGYFQTVDDFAVPSLKAFELQALTSLAYAALTGEASSANALTEVLTAIWPTIATNPELPPIDEALAGTLDEAVANSPLDRIRDVPAVAPYLLLVAAPAMAGIDEFREGMKPAKPMTIDQFLRPIVGLLQVKAVYESEFDTGPLSLDGFYDLLVRLHFRDESPARGT